MFAVVSYVMGTAAIVYFVWALWFGLDATEPAFQPQTVIQNLLLFLIFPLQHSLLARPQWKRWIKRRIQPLMERPVYVATSALALTVVVRYWQPFGPLLFVSQYRWLFDTLFFLSVAGILWSAATIDQSTLFGLKHGIAAWKGTSLPAFELIRRGPFAYVRHPLTSFLIVAIWSHHVLTAGRLEWNILITAYSLIGVVFEERDIRKELGAQYEQYCRSVPAFIPSLRSLIERRR